MNPIRHSAHFACALLALSTLAGCASTPTPTGAVLPIEGGRYQHSITAADPAMALKIFTYDVEITCGNNTGKTRMPWEAAPPPAKYVVLSQVMKDKDGKDIKSDNKMLDAGIAVGLRRLGLESQDKVQSTTIFKCG